MEALYRTRYAGFTAKHFHERLVKDHNFGWGYTWTKTFLYSKLAYPVRCQLRSRVSPAAAVEFFIRGG